MGEFQCGHIHLSVARFHNFMRLAGRDPPAHTPYIHPAPANRQPSTLVPATREYQAVETGEPGITGLGDYHR